ncbi:MAG TPA: hypothetical protein VMR52_07185 [Dehalococcoidia bacterium]|nr:hypothetical protein [Dehalococcoidia bacterium]
MTQVGPFELIDVPPLGEPRMLVALQPWVDVGSVGTMAALVRAGHSGALVFPVLQGGAASAGPTEGVAVTPCVC